MSRLSFAVLLVLAVATISYATYFPYAEGMHWKYEIRGYESYWDRVNEEDSYQDSLSGTMFVQVLDAYEFAGESVYEVANLYTIHYHDEAEPFSDWDGQVFYIQDTEDYIYIYEWLEDIAPGLPVSEIPVNPEVGDSWEIFESFWIYDYVRCEVVEVDVDFEEYSDCIKLDLSSGIYEEGGEFSYFWYLAPEVGVVYITIEDHYKDSDVKYDDIFEIRLVEFAED